MTLWVIGVSLAFARKLFRSHALSHLVCFRFALKMEENTDAVMSTTNCELNDDNEVTKKKTVPGVMYISTIPPGITPFHLKQVFERYGEVGRIFLQPDGNTDFGAPELGMDTFPDAVFLKEKKGPKRQKGRKKHTFNKGKYSEGWVEMADKRLAKRLARTLNNTAIVEWKKSKSKCIDYMWNVKYLHRFRWTHLTEKLSYEKAVRQQKLRTEFAQARKETEEFIANVDASKKYASIKERKEKKGIKLMENRRQTNFRQRKTVQEIREARGKVENKSKSLLSSIFTS